MSQLRILRAITCAASIAALACGDDDGETLPADAGMDASNGGTGGGGGGGGGSTITPLGDAIAGKACDGSDDCDGAMCAAQVASTDLLATPAPAPGGYCTGPCENDGHCGEGGACVGALPGLVGRCFARCDDADDCRQGYLCGGGGTIGPISIPNTCRPLPETDQLADDVAGAECSEDADCEGGQCATTRGLLMEVLPGGYCSGVCLQDEHCGGGSVCAPSPLPGSPGSCFRSCGDDGDCPREGYRCRQVGEGVRGCDAAPDPLPDNSAGMACTEDSDCGGNADSCADSLPGGTVFQRLPAPGGYCTEECEGQDDCGAGGVCVGNFFAQCFKACADPDDCRDGYTCEMRGGSTMADAGTGTLVCVPEPMPSDADAG